MYHINNVCFCGKCLLVILLVLLSITVRNPDTPDEFKFRKYLDKYLNSTEAKKAAGTRNCTSVK